MEFWKQTTPDDATTASFPFLLQKRREFRVNYMAGGSVDERATLAKKIAKTAKSLAAIKNLITMKDKKVVSAQSEETQDIDAARTTNVQYTATLPAREWCRQAVMEHIAAIRADESGEPS
jgi:hypothetical protein